jgi:hypothetical protein
MKHFPHAIVVGFALALATHSAGVTGNKSRSDDAWPSILGATCPLCISASETRASLPVSVSERAVIYFPTGEFATIARWYVVDLDTGTVVFLVKSLEPGAASTEQRWQLNPEALSDLRGASIGAWRKRPPRRIFFTPGANPELDVMAGERMVSFNPDDPSVSLLMNIVDRVVRTAPPASKAGP